MNGHYLSTKKGFVAGFDADLQVVQFAKDERHAKRFSSTAELNRWLDQHVNCGYGLSWTDEVRVRRAEKLDKAVAESDARLAAAVSQLSRSERGRAALASFAGLVMRGPAAGLDSKNWEALVAVVQEAAAGRRDFLSEVLLRDDLESERRVEAANEVSP